MNRKGNPFRIVALVTGLSLSHSLSFSQESVNTKVVVTGAMRETMWNGQLAGLIELDSLKYRNHFFGIGPVEYLQGEVMLLGDSCFVSRVNANGSASVESQFDVKAPFFVHAWVDEWKPIRLHSGVINLETLEAFLDSATKTLPRPLAFRLDGAVKSARVHIMNLPAGTPVHEPTDAHWHQVEYTIENEAVRILGFFSTQHQRVFTHHDTFLHLHLITTDGRLMGHVDELELKADELKLQVGL